MSKKILTSLFFFLYVFYMHSQQNNIEGTVLNLDKTYAEYLLVSLVKNDSVIQSMHTDSLGRYGFKIDLPCTGCKIMVSEWGNTLYVDTIGHSSEYRVIKDIVLEKTNVIEMNEIVIGATRSGLSVKNNKLVYTPKEQELKVNTVFDVLKQTPLVKVDDASVTLVGKTGTLIYINGKEMHIPLDVLIENLKTMPAENLKNIEIIANPGSEHSASTSGGVINILLKKQLEEGFWSQITVQDRQGIKNSQYLLPNFRYRVGNFGFDGTISLSNNNPSYKQGNFVEMRNSGDGQYTPPSPMDFKIKSINVNLNAEYELNDRHSFNFLSLLRFAKPIILSNTSTSYYNVYTNIIKDTITHTQSEQKDSKINSYFFNLNYLYKIDDSVQKLLLSADFINYNYKQHQYTTTAYSLNNRSFGWQRLSSFTPQDTKSYSFKVDYTVPFGEFFLDMGANYSFNRNVTSYTEEKDDIVDKNADTNFSYKEYLIASYLKLSRTWSQKVSASFGLRVENMKTIRKLQSINPENWNANKFKLYPSLSINYILNKSWTFNYSISNSVRRPAFWQLNPSKFYINKDLYAVENPFLKNTYTVSQEMSVTYNQKYYFSIAYNYIQDATAQFMIPDEQSQNVNFYNRFNYGNVNNVLFTLSVPFKLRSNFWSGNATLETSYNHYIYTNDELRKYYSNDGSWTSLFILKNTFTLSKKQQLWANIDIMYQSPVVDVYKRTRMMTPMLDFELKKALNNWTFSFKVNAILNAKTRTVALENSKSPYLGSGFTTISEARIMQLRVAYSLGNGKIKKNRKSQLANDEIQNRLK